MAYKPKQLVSVRLNTDDLKVIDDWAKEEHHLKRSDAVDAAVRLAAWMIKNGHAQKLIYFYPAYDTMDKFEMDYHRGWK